MDKKTNYSLPKLDYSYDALAPIISKENLTVHFEKHHQNLITNLNKVLDEYHFIEKSSKNTAFFNESILAPLHETIKFNGGGHINHSFFWKCLTKKKSEQNTVSKILLSLIEKNFVSFENFKKIFIKKGLSFNENGWIWAVYNKNKDSLEIFITKNNDYLSKKNLFPLFIIDLWDHAYDKQYNNKNKYLEGIFDIINFYEVENRYKNAFN